MREYKIPSLLLKAEKVIQSCNTLDQLLVATRFNLLANEQLTVEEYCALHGYLRCKAHSLNYSFEE